MKKSLVALFCVFALVAFTVPAFALHGVPEMFEYQPQKVMASKAQITLGGSIRIRGEVSDNNDDFRDTDDNMRNASDLDSVTTNTDDSQEFYDQRVRLSVDAVVSPNTRGFVELEAGSDTSDTYKWGCDSSGASGMYQSGNCKKGAMYIRQAYVAHQGTALGVLSGFKAGHMLLGLGNGLFFDHTKFGDDALVFWIQPADGTEISVATIKFKEASTNLNNSDDTNVYALMAESSFAGVNISGDVTWVDDNNFGAGGGQTGDGRVNLDLWNIGLRADWTGPVTVMGDVEFQTGTLEDWKTNGDDMDLSGWALMLGVSADIPGNVGVHGNFAYGSGDDIDSNDDYEGFMTSLSSGQHYTYLYDQHAKTAAQGAPSTSTTMSSAYGNGNNTGLNNTWYLNVGVSVDPTPDLGIAADVYYLEASEKVSSTAGYDDQEIGIEVDGKITYQIDTNFVYYIEAGYLFAGDFYTNVISDTDTSKIDDPWSIRHGVELKF